jgi:hypothetical protein
VHGNMFICPVYTGTEHKIDSGT